MPTGVHGKNMLRNAAAAVAGLLGLGCASAVSAAPDDLGRTISSAIEAEGGLFTAEERAVISARCGYGRDEWNGRGLRIDNGVLVCSNGRRVDDPEVRAISARVGERVSARVEKVMASKEVAAAIRRKADESVRASLRHHQSFDGERIARARAHARAHALAPRHDLEAIRLHARSHDAPHFRYREMSKAERRRFRRDMERLRADMSRLGEVIRRDVHESIDRDFPSPRRP